MTTSRPGLLRLSRRAVQVALAALMSGPGAAGPAVAASTRESAPSVPTTTTPLSPRSPKGQPTPAARALTEAGCCARHWWSSDSLRVLFIDDPPGDAPLGIYAAPAGGGEVGLASLSVLGEDLPAGDAPLAATPSASLRLPAAAENVRLSPDGLSVAWTVGSSVPVNVHRRHPSLFVLGGPTDLRRRLAVLTGGDLVGWAEDGRAVVATGRVSADAVAGIWRVPIDGSPPALLAEADRPRGVRLSPTARWLAYYLAFQTDPARNGLWIAGTSGAAAHQVPAFGSYRWGADERLFFIPFV